MELIEIPAFNPNLALALGFFDGVHIAHQTLIREAVSFAKKNGLCSGVLTFKNNPMCSFGVNNINYIYSNDDKFKIFEELGVDFVYALDFDKYLNLSAEEYLNDVIIKNFNPKLIVTGFNHYFGKNKAGNPELLRKYQEKYGYIYKEINPIMIDSKLVSTTNIKKMLEKGDIISANRFLGRDFRIKSKVEKGSGIGGNLGFKTANLNWGENIIKLPYGVYKTTCLIDGKIYNSLSNWGICPTLNLKNETLEVHILGFSGNIYGREIEVFFKEKIRDEKKFNSKEELISQINEDLKVF